MKNLKYLLFTTVIILTVNSCRKGKDDPFFSLMTRKARLTNDWILTEGNQTVTQTFNSNTTTTEYLLTQDSITMQLGDNNISFAYKETISFKKDNSFIITVKQEVQGASTYTIIYSGQWTFLESGNGYKKKERVELKTEEVTTTYAGNSNTVTYNNDEFTYILYLTKLSKKELNFDFNYNINDENVNIDISGSKQFIQE